MIMNEASTLSSAIICIRCHVLHPIWIKLCKIEWAAECMSSSGNEILHEYGYVNNNNIPAYIQS